MQGATTPARVARPRALASLATPESTPLLVLKAATLAALELTPRLRLPLVPTAPKANMLLARATADADCATPEPILLLKARQAVSLVPLERLHLRLALSAALPAVRALTLALDSPAVSTAPLARRPIVARPPASLALPALLLPVKDLLLALRVLLVMPKARTAWARVILVLRERNPLQVALPLVKLAPLEKSLLLLDLTRVMPALLESTVAAMAIFAFLVRLASIASPMPLHAPLALVASSRRMRGKAPVLLVHPALSLSQLEQNSVSSVLRANTLLPMALRRVTPV